ncbi:MAG: hypothetical protein ABI954_07935 [Pyrinomonadaceae bacterium]
MSRIEGKQHLQVTPDFGGKNTGSNAKSDSEQSKNVYVANNDSSHDKFCAHEGIDRGRGNKHGLHGKKVGDQVNIIDGATTLTGRILKDNGDTLDVLVGDKVYIVEKENGKSKGHRKASDAEMKQGEQMEQYQQEQARIQEEQSARLDESIQDDKEKHDVKLYNQKIELRVDDLKKIDNKKKAVQSLSSEFQFQAPKTEYHTLTVAEIILSKDREDELKK